METPPKTGFLDHLRSLTWHRHEAFERLPFITALMKGTLPLECYIGQLRGLAIIFSALEQTLAQSQSAAIVRVRPLLKSRFDMLCADLAFFSPQLVPDILPAVNQASEIARKIRAASFISTGKLLGFLYVLEGTTKGNQVHLPDIERCFHLNNDVGGSFYRGYGAETDTHWHEFCAAMDGVDEDIVKDALRGTVEIYDALEQFHAALYPVAMSARGFTATALNPEAGEHCVPQDPAVLQAALRAGRRCREAFSYYERRYGDRGRRFTDSDAAWLAALTDQPVAIVTDQVIWLGRVLSARGMPFLLMERQLELLVEELGNLEKAIPTESLQSLIAYLRQQRCDLVSNFRFDEACHRLSEILSDTRVSDIPDLPLILVAAQVDRLAGMPECMASLLSWLRSDSGLTEEQIEAAQRVLASMHSSDGAS